MIGSATISPCGTYRYILRREWETWSPSCYWIMLNPSTADEKQDDPTIRRVVSFSREWGFGSAHVLNLFALRATDPRELRAHADPIGPQNDHFLSTIPLKSTIVAAWGTGGDFMRRALDVRLRFRGRLSCLGLTKDEHPRHPLYVKSGLGLRPYPCAEGA